MKGKKTGGRTANTPNKATADFKAAATLKYPNFNPLISLLDIYHDKQIDIKIRMDALKEVSKKFVPDLKAIEHTIDTDPFTQITRTILTRSIENQP